MPPFNYYLLFAITCHISLLHSCSEYNKMNYNNLCICFQPAIKIDAFCFQFLILDWRNCWQGCWTEKEYLVEEVKLLEPPKPQPPASRNGPALQTSGKTKGSQANSGHLGDALKPSSARSTSSSRSKTSGRGASTDGNTSGRGTPPSSSLYNSEKSSEPKPTTNTSQRDASAERAVSSSHSRETFDPRGTSQRAPPSIAMESANEEDDSSATPTQAQHARVPSENTFRLDLSHPPNSPFSVKF